MAALGCHEMTRKEALDWLAASRRAELAQAACHAFDAYQDPQPNLSSCKGKGAGVVQSGAFRLGQPLLQEQQGEPEKRFANKCFVTVLDREYLHSTFTKDGGVLKVIVKMKLPPKATVENAQLYAILSIETEDSSPDAGGTADSPSPASQATPTPTLRDQAFLILRGKSTQLKEGTMEQFLIRNKHQARLRVQLYDHVPERYNGSDDGAAVTGRYPLDKQEESMRVTFKVALPGFEGNQAEISLKWQLTRFEDLPKEPKNQKKLNKQALFKRLLFDGRAPKSEERLMSWLAGLFLPGGMLSPGTGKKGKSKAAEPDSFHELRKVYRESRLEDLQPLAFVDAPGSDTQVWLHHDGCNKVVVSFRGSSSVMDFFVDAVGHWVPADEVLAPPPKTVEDQGLPTPAAGRVSNHAGFVVAYSNVRSAVRALVKAYFEHQHQKRQEQGSQPVGKDSRTLIITGHSLGGALATVMAYDVARQQELHKHAKLFDQLRVYTFASPRVGNKAFMQEYNMLVPETWRVTNPDDIVPRIPDNWDMRDGGNELYYHVGAHINLREDDPASDTVLPVVGEGEGYGRRRPDVNWWQFIRRAFWQLVRLRLLQMKEIAQHYGKNYAPSLRSLLHISLSAKRLEAVQAERVLAA